MGVNVILFTDCSSIAFARSAGAYRIASELRKHGYTVQVVEHFIMAGLERTLRVLEKFIDETTLFLGFSTTFMNVSRLHLDEDSSTRFKIQNVTRVFSGAGVKGDAYGVPISDDDMQAIRDKALSLNPKVKLVIGGTKADYFLQPQIDTFVVGYADHAIIEYARFLEGKNPFFQSRYLDDGRMVIDSDIKGSKFNFQQSAITYHESDLIRPGEVLPIETARGCIFKCKFCSFPLIGKKKNDYIKSTEVLYSELMGNYEKFGTTKYIFVDDTYNESVPKLEAFATVFQRLPFKIEYVAYLRHDLLWKSPEMADLLKESGLKVAVFGLETLNPTAGKIIGKGLDPEKGKELFHWLRSDKGWKGNVLMSSGFIVGLPTENAKTVSKWLEELMSYDYPLDTFIINALGLTPGAVRTHKSEFEFNYEKYGYYFDPNVSYSWINEHWRYEDAKQLADDALSYAFETGRIRAYGFIAMMLHNYGYSWNDVFNTNSISKRGEVFNMTVKMADDYYTRLLT
jgi:radical SAM superfamily enzyme YgiQ (UPF0313 family)